MSEPFGVILFDKVARRYIGNGRSIAEAAKNALKQRNGTTADNADGTDKKKGSE